MATVADTIDEWGENHPIAKTVIKVGLVAMGSYRQPMSIPVTRSGVLLDTGSVIKYNSTLQLLGPGEQAVVNETTVRELIDVGARKGFSGALPNDVSVIGDDVSMTLRGQVMQSSKMFGAASQGMENDAAIGATALARGIPLITTDYALANAVMKLGGQVRYLEP